MVHSSRPAALVAAVAALAGVAGAPKIFWGLGGAQLKIYNTQWNGSAQELGAATPSFGAATPPFGAARPSYFGAATPSFGAAYAVRGG